MRLVFTHGIGNARMIEDGRAEWTAALATGAHHAGHSRFADRLDASEVDIAFAYYADLFGLPETQGPNLDLTFEEAAVLSALLAEVIEEKLHDSVTDGRTREMLLHAHAQLRPPTSAPTQGLLEPVRVLINVATTLLSVPPLGRAGQWLTARFMLLDLAQVARYLARGEIDCTGHPLDARIRLRVEAALGDGPAVVVAHSLGSAVAFETLHQRSVNVPLLITLGSPIGLRAAVWPRLRPHPPSTPEGVQRWLNFWDRDDIIAARPLLEQKMKPNAAGVLPDSIRVDSDGFWVHNATKYLAKAEVAGRIAEVLSPPPEAP